MLASQRDLARILSALKDLPEGHLLCLERGRVRELVERSGVGHVLVDPTRAATKPGRDFLVGGVELAELVQFFRVELQLARAAGPGQIDVAALFVASFAHAVTLAGYLAESNIIC